VDMDFFSSDSAPGASQTFPIGITANQFLPFWQNLCVRHKPLLSSFYEVSPPLDFDNRSSRLAAILIHQFISRILN